AGSSLEVLPTSVLDGLSPAVHPLDPSANGAVEGQLVDAGIGEPDDFPAGTEGKIALIQRGDLFFTDKVTNAEAAGAIGVIIYNNLPGLFAGQLSGPSSIPALTMSQEDGAALIAMMKSGPVSARLEVSTESGPQRSQNVVARPPDGTCRVVAGGHYDTVAAGPGANDNASGTATVVETARVMAGDGVFGDVCFVLFGAEEVGFIGSERFVDSLAAQGEPPEAMLNFDMVGVGFRWLLAGTPSLTDVATAEADEFGLDYDVPSSASANGGSDHASFINAGIPAVFFHSLFTMVADDPNYHTSEDQAEHIQPNRLAEIGEVGLAMIDTLLTSR
ncbi:MAG: M20/M25/M40 family metallo-hydrolase, partial [Dehalococcoidia bacterium]